MKAVSGAEANNHGRAVPTALKLKRGNPGKQRLNLKEPHFHRGNKPPVPPRHLNGVAREEWQRIVDELHQLGLLTTVDLNVFAVYCQTYARWVDAELQIARPDGTMQLTLTTDKGNEIYNPAVAVAMQAARDLVKYAVEFGFTPSSRSRIVIKETEQQDGLDELIVN